MKSTKKIRYLKMTTIRNGKNEIVFRNVVLK